MFFYKIPLRNCFLESNSFLISYYIFISVSTFQEIFIIC
uniref:Uncharacterized protein n=1 Tax=Siphoviridae sp. ctEw721 TaxID=2825400 RepID=A0A8S5TS13_9CAUD|nr:MAG TPA: hypothetical protein [Siphoviridae sp. ctEw721]